MSISGFSGESFTYSCECGDQFEDVELLSVHLLEKHNAVLLQDETENNESQVQIPSSKEAVSQELNKDTTVNVESTGTVEECNDVLNESYDENQHDTQANRLSPSTEHVLHEYFCKTLQMDRNEKIRICETCRKMFLNKQSFISHCLNTHTGPGKIYGGKWRKGQPYTCEKCGEIFPTRPNFLKHQEDRHSEMQPFRCPVCLQYFPKKIDLKIHFRTHTEGQQKVDEVPVKSPRKRRSAFSTVVCDVCNKEFKNKQCLIIHMLTHSTERPYKCSYCPKAFKMSVTLKNHTRTHTGEKPYGCPMCPQRFTNNVNLASHQRIHTGERPYGCQECPKAFRNKAALSRHVRVHTGEKPYACGFCCKSFSQSNTMKLHVRTVHMKLPWPYKKKPRDIDRSSYTFEADI